MTLLIPFFLAASLPASGCQAIESETVLARDVAQMIPAFSQLPPDFLIGYVQSSGAQHLFHGEELERIAKNRGLDLHGLDDVCFVRRMFIPDAAPIRESMQKALGVPGARIEILSSGQQAVPFGEIIFLKSGVQGFAGSELTWHGYVRAGENGRYPVWARVRITAPMNRVIAITDLPAGKPIQKDQIRLESTDDSPFDEITARSLDEVVGLIAKTSIPRSSPVRKTQIERPMDVARGAIIRVEVYAGAAHLSLEARAETAGMVGSFITVRNLASGRDFRAEVTGKDHVMVGEHAQ